MPKIAIPVAQDYNSLVAAANPSAAAGGPETVPWWFYDTQLYTSATTTEVTFFSAPGATPDLSNMVAAGALPDPNFFGLHYINFDFISNVAGTPYLTVSSAAATVPATGALNDVGSLLLSGRGRFKFVMSDKQYGPWPLSVTGGTGAALGFMAVLSGTTLGTASQSEQFAYNALTGGAYIGGKIIIPPKVGFQVVADWPAALTLTGNYYIRCTFYGVYYRRIL
jgi:hypothetical protein